MTGEPAHTTSKERMMPEINFKSEHAPQLSITDLKVKCPLHFTYSYIQPVIQHYKRRTVGAAINLIITTNNMDDSHAQLSITTLQEKWLIRFSFTYFQLITRCYE